jgi:hypothetical protein
MKSALERPLYFAISMLFHFGIIVALYLMVPARISSQQDTIEISTIGVSGGAPFPKDSAPTHVHAKPRPSQPVLLATAPRAPAGSGNVEPPLGTLLHFATTPYPEHCLNQGIEGQLELRATFSNGELNQVDVIKDAPACPEFREQALDKLKHAEILNHEFFQNREIHLLIPFRFQIRNSETHDRG